jgi:aromatic-L-amino-acid decarboxylase
MASLSVSPGGTLELRLPLRVVLLSAGSAAIAWTLALGLYTRRRGRYAPATSSEDFVRSGVAILRWLTNYRSRTCRQLPIVSTVAPNYLRDSLPATAPEEPEPFSNILSDLSEKILPGLTHWENSASFFAYFKPHSSYPAVLGELVCAGLNVMGFDWIASPACTELEVVTLDWLGKLLQLPERFLSCSAGPGGAVIQGSAGEAAIVILLAATRRAQSRRAAASRSAGAPLLGGAGATADACTGAAADDVGRSRCVVYCSDQTHAIIKKACMVLGLRCRALPTSVETGFTLRGEVLAAAIDADLADLAENWLPVAVVGTSGTTTSCAFDPLDELADVCTPRGLWLHVDAAYGGAYACLDEVRPLFAGLERCDSFCVNAHKKLLVPFDLAALYVADRRPLLHALSLTPEYLRNDASESGAVVDYEHWQLGLGRRFRALKLWFVMRRFGASGVRAHVRAGMVLARRFADLVATSEVFELAAPPSLSLVCFRLMHARVPHGSEDDDALHMEFLARAKARNVFIIRSRLGGRLILRFACGGIEQTVQEVERAFEILRSVARDWMASTMMTFRDVAQHFGNSIAANNYPAAFELLTPEAQAFYTPESLKAAVASMTCAAPGGIQEVEVIEEGILEDWSAKQPGDVASVYVALTGVGFAEAVAVIVVQRNCNLLIRHLEWGRP